MAAPRASELPAVVVERQNRPWTTLPYESEARSSLSGPLPDQFTGCRTLGTRLA